MCNNARTECSGDPAAGAGAADEAVCRNVVWRQSGECQCGVQRDTAYMDTVWTPGLVTNNPQTSLLTLPQEISSEDLQS